MPHCAEPITVMDRPAVQQIINAAALATGVPSLSLLQRNRRGQPIRRTRVVQARAAAAAALQRTRGMSLHEIAAAVGWDSHSSAHAALRRADPQLTETVIRLAGGAA